MIAEIKPAGGAGWVGATAVVFGVLFWVLSWHPPAGASDHSEADPRHRPARSSEPDRLAAHLYFADKRGKFLTAVQRTIPRTGNPRANAAAIVNALIRGPRKGLMRVLPPETGLRALYILGDGTAVVDLTDSIREHHHGGVQMERLTLFAIVNSLILNVPEIQAVKILIDGREARTLAGHLDLRFPYKADMLRIR